MRGKRIALAVAAALVFGLALPGSAAVGPTGDNSCFTKPGGNPVDFCTIVLPIHPGPPNPCHCDSAFAPGLPSGTPAGTTNRVDTDLANGIGLLGTAATTTDPGQAQQDRNQAQAAFADAATAIGAAPLGQPTVGYIDPNSHAFVSYPNQWRVDVGNYLTNGLLLMRQGQTTSAMSDFQAAYTELDQHNSAVS
jgi:hypothetical protein